MQRTLIGAGLVLALSAGMASAATVTVVSSGVVSTPAGGEAVYQNTTVATFTTAQDVARVDVSPGLWACSGKVYGAAAATQTGGTTSVSTTTATHATAGATLASKVIVDIAAATSGLAFNTGTAMINATVKTPVYLVHTNAVTTTVTAALVCSRVSK